MKKVILDTSFILSCVRHKIDFVDDLEFMGFEILVPKQVFGELDGITRSKQKAHSRDEAFFAIRILETSEDKFDEVDLKGSNVDNSILEYAKSHKDVAVATLDAELKRKIPNTIIVIKEKNRIGVA